VETLKQMHPAIRTRVLEKFLKDSGVREPEAVHIARVEDLIASDKPSARADLPGGITVSRNYGILEVRADAEAIQPVRLTCPGSVELADYVVSCCWAEEIIQSEDTFTVLPEGEMILRGRESGDSIRLPGGNKSLKKLFIDRKIPASRRSGIPVIADEAGVLGVYSIGPNRDRTATNLPAVQIRFHKR
jgi:tRNA(Ile)-lysidine synthase